MNEIDSYLLFPLCVLYEIQNQIFQQVFLKKKKKNFQVVKKAHVILSFLSHFVIFLASFCNTISSSSTLGGRLDYGSLDWSGGGIHSSLLFPLKNGGKLLNDLNFKTQ